MAWTCTVPRWQLELGQNSWFICSPLAPAFMAIACTCFGNAPVTSILEAVERYKDGLRVITVEVFSQHPQRYEVRENDPLAPACAYGNQRQFIGFDTDQQQYVWLTKSVLKKLLAKT